MDAAENIFVDHYDTSEVSQARILCLCFLFLFVVFQQEKNALEVADFCCRNAVQVQLCNVLRRRTELLVLFFVFSEDMSSLKIFISSSVYVTIDPGTLPLSLLRLVWLNFLLAIF